MKNFNFENFMNGLNEKQKQAVLACRNEVELEKVMDDHDIEVPCEMLEMVTGGKGIMPVLMAGIMAFSGASTVVASISDISVSADVTVSGENASSVVYGGDLAKGMTIELKSSVYEVIDVQHIKPGKGCAFARIKCMDISTGSIREDTINRTEKIIIAPVDCKEIIYSYSDGDQCFFMRTDNYEIISMPRKYLPKGFDYIKEDMGCKIFMYKDKILKVELPELIKLRVTETDMSFTTLVGSGTKQAVLETGAVIIVSSDIRVGDSVIVNTKTGDFVERG